MTDQEFADRLEELQAQGKAGIEPMRALIKENGGMARVIALAVRGARRAKKGKERAAALLPGDFPDERARQDAIAYWRKRGRSDLETAIDLQIDKFRVHFSDVRRKSWRGTWRTWFSNAPEYVRDEGGVSTSFQVVFEQTTLAGWVSRLETQAGFTDVAKGFWSPKWGPPYPQPGHRVPAGAIDVFERRRHTAVAGHAV